MPIREICGQKSPSPMDLKTFLDKFELFADAPDAVAKMRELVLNLAMAGQLVGQDAKEGTATALLSSISNQRRLLHEREGIKPKKETKNTVQPYTVPRNWTWTTLANAGHDLGQEKPSSTISYIDVASIDNKRGEISNKVEPIEAEKAPSRARKKIRRGTVIYSTVRPYLLNIAIVDRDFTPPPIASTAFGILFPYEGIHNRFLFYWLRSKAFTNYVESQMKGMAYPAINDAKFYSAPFPLPPLAEQKRIVAKVDALMTLCDQLEAQQQARDTRQAALARASLARFADAPTPANLNFLFSSSFNIHPSSLRQSILTLAVQGKLVSSVGDTEVLPLGEILSEPSSNGISKGPTPDTSATEVLRISAGTSRDDFYVDEDDFKHVDLSASEIQKAQLKKGDLLACRYNGNLHYVGMFSLYRGASGRIQVNPDKLIRFRVDTTKHDPRYVCFSMNAVPTRKSIEAMCATTAGNIGLSAGRIKTVPIPLPPLAEQRHIVTKVDQLMALVDELETQLAESRSVAQKLLEALVARLSVR